MSYPFKIAWRYFFSKSKQTVINRINAFAFFMVVVATASLFVVLSAFAGLKDFGLSFTNTFDADYKILPERGTYFRANKQLFSELEKLPEVLAAAPEIEEKVFLSYKEKNQVAFLKAVSPEYTSVVPIDSLIALGDWLSFENSDVVVGFGIAGSMGLGVYDYTTFLNITVPKKKQQSLLNQNPFTSAPTMVSGLFQISEDLDKKYLFSNLHFGRTLLNLNPDEVTAVVLKTLPGISKQDLYNKTAPLFHDPIQLLSRAEQNAALYRMLNTEHLAIYFIFTLVMIIALFNVVGSLIMMILDKKQQLRILLTLGAEPKGIHQIFFFLGLIICGIGGAVGLTLGAVLVLIQGQFPFIYVPGTSLVYPVLFESKNIALVFGTLMLLGSLSTAWATKGLTKKMRAYTTS